MRRSRTRRILAGLGRVVVYGAAFIVLLVLVVVLGAETAWGKRELRDLLVGQTREYLNATLEIEALEGSLFRGVRLRGVRLVQDGAPVVEMDAVAVTYSLRELFDRGTTIRRLTVSAPRIVVERRDEDGRWNLATLVRPRPPRQGPRGPRRPIHIESLEVVDGSVLLRDPLSFGIARVPGRYDALHISGAFHLEPDEWRLELGEASWSGGSSDLTMTRLAGGIVSGSAGWRFDDVQVRTPESAFRFSGKTVRSSGPTVLDLSVEAERFSFQEWSLVVRELRSIDIDARFTTHLEGPLDRLATKIDLDSNGGSVVGDVTLNTRVPGWRGAGTIDVTRLDLAPWFSRPDRPSDISGRVTFDLVFGRRFPRGRYTFNGAHAAYLGYEADDVVARGTLTDTQALMSSVTAVAYGANLRISSGSIGINAPYPYHFVGVARGVDLRRLPREIPIPHVESVLNMAFDATGRFSRPFITASATFAPSTFLGAAIGDGMQGAIDTAVSPVRYSGEGDVTDIDLHRFGAGLEVAWLQDPRYAGTVSGRFHVTGEGGEAASMTLSGGGRVTQADLFDGRLTEADVSIEIAEGTLAGSYDGRFEGIDPAIPFADPRLEGSLTGAGRATARVAELLVRTPALADYRVDGQFALQASEMRGVEIEAADIAATLADGDLTLTTFDAVGPGIEAQAAGRVAFAEGSRTALTYRASRIDLARLKEIPPLADAVGSGLSGLMTAAGELTGTWTSMHTTGRATVSDFAAPGVAALTTAVDYEAEFNPQDPAVADVRMSGRSTFLQLFERPVQQMGGVITYVNGRAGVDLNVDISAQLVGAIRGSFVVDAGDRRVGLEALRLTIGRSEWQMVPAPKLPAVSWGEGQVAVTPVSFVDAATTLQRIDLSGTWRADGRGAMRVGATRVSLDALFGSPEGPARYGGWLDARATISGTRDNPVAFGTLSITEGRIRRLPYERLAGRIDFAAGELDIDLRLDQAPEVWLTAVGRVPMRFFDASLADGPLNVRVRSSPISLTLIEGVTDVVRDVTGQMVLDVTAVGSSRDPQFQGSAAVNGAAFTVAATGALYRNASAALRLERERVIFEAVHVEDRDRHTLDVKGSLATRELTVGEVAIDIAARQFEVLRNAYGTMEVDADLDVAGLFQLPRITGRITVTSGNLDVDAILDRTLFQPYATVAAPGPSGEVDAIAALNPWERLGLDIELHVPNTLRMEGDDVQVAGDTPIGLGDINMRVLGDLYLYKDPAQPLYVTGSFDQVTGNYAFQGRRFEIDPTSSINFRGDLSPELYVTVNREISGVETRITISGPLREPELRMASTPPLEETDILSLIVFNTSTNQLTGAQQRELAVRAATLTAGFVAAPLVTALERTLGLDILEIEASSEVGNTARVTVGDEIAPGLVARFTRQFGDLEYGEATIEYYLSRLFRIRATFSDAGPALRRSAFRRVERAGIDLLVFLSF